MGRLFWKFFLAFWLALLLAGASVGTLFWLHRQNQAAASQDLAISPRSAFQINASLATLRHGGPVALRELFHEWDRETEAHVYVVDEQGKEILGRKVSPEAIAKARDMADTPRLWGPTAASAETGSDGHTYLFFVPGDRSSPGEPARRHPHPPWGLLIAGDLLASLLVSGLLAWYLAKPIRSLRWAFNKVSAGHLETRVSRKMGRRRDEIADLGVDFDRMALRLQQLVGGQRRLLHDVSHELRSPLARVQAAIGLARQQPERTNACMDRIEQEASRLDELVGQLLTLSRLEAGMPGSREEDLDLNELVGAVADDARFEAEAQGKGVSFLGDGEALLQGQPELLHRAFDNVIRNALKYTAPGTAVEVQARTEPLPDGRHCFRLTVADRGPGVAEADLDTIFNPFFRGENGGFAEGFGLGLAIAQRAIQAHGGSIVARNREGGGLTITILMPLQPPGAAEA